MPDSPRAPGPPNNPHVRDLVRRKQQWASNLRREDARAGFRGWNERGYLPHRDEPGLVQFITFRLADSFPAPLRDEWQHLWKLEDSRRRRAELEAYLDRGLGECHLREPAVMQVVEEALRFFHGQRYELRAWAIMPNHVHVLFRIGEVPMSNIVQSWKKHSAQKANRLLRRSGPFWQPDYWDTFMRDHEHETNSRDYIERNPVKAGLVSTAQEWPASSARFRNEAGSWCCKRDRSLRRWLHQYTGSYRSAVCVRSTSRSSECRRANSSFANRGFLGALSFLLRYHLAAAGAEHTAALR